MSFPRLDCRLPPTYNFYADVSTKHSADHEIRLRIAIGKKASSELISPGFSDASLNYYIRSR